MAEEGQVLAELPVLQIGRPLPGPSSELLPDTYELFKEAHMLTKLKTLLGRGAQGREPRRTVLPLGSKFLFFWGGMQLVSGLSLVRHLAWSTPGLAQDSSW